MSVGIGMTVAPTRLVNVRATPALPGGAIVGTQASGARGVIVGGPVSDAAGDTSGYTWWQITFATGVSGWSAAPFLAAVLAPTPPAPVTVQTLGGALVTVTRRPANTGAPAQLTVDPDAVVTVNGAVN